MGEPLMRPPRRAGLPGQGGQSVVELALVLPLLVMLMIVVVDVSRAVQAYNVIANLSREGANLTLRNPSSTGVQEIMNSLANSSWPPLRMNRYGMMYVTRVEKAENAIRTHQVPWQLQQGKAVPASRFRLDSIPSSILNRMKNGDRIYVFEVFYRYDSLFKKTLDFEAFSPQLHTIAIF